MCEEKLKKKKNQQLADVEFSKASFSALCCVWYSLSYAPCLYGPGMN